MRTCCGARRRPLVFLNFSYRGFVYESSRECNGVCVAVTCFSGAVSVVRRTLMGGFPLGENDVTSP